MWGIIRFIFVIMVIVEVVLTIVAYAQRNVDTEVNIEHSYEHGVPYPNLLLCPRSPINRTTPAGDDDMLNFIFAHVTPSNLPKDIAELQSNVNTRELARKLGETTNENYTYTLRLRSYYESFGYQCESIIDKCQTAHAHGIKLDCCKDSRTMPTYYGPCVFLQLESIMTKQYIPGQSGGIRLDINRQVDKGDQGEIMAFLLDRWHFYPSSSLLTLMPNNEYFLNVRANRRFILDTRKKTWGEKVEDWKEEWDEEFERSKGGRTTMDAGPDAEREDRPLNNRRDCVFQCQMSVIAEMCGCVPFYADLGTNLAISHHVLRENGKIHVCNINETINCAAEAALNTTIQLVADVKSIAGDEADTMRKALGINGTTDKKTLKDRIRDKWTEFKKSWWKIGYSEPRDCVSQCTRGDLVTTYETSVGSFPLKASAGQEVPMNTLHIAYADLSVTTYREHFAMSFSEMFWVMGTSVAIWVVVYLIIKFIYDFVKSVCFPALLVIIPHARDCCRC